MDRKTNITAQRVREIAAMLAPWMSRVYSPERQTAAHQELCQLADQMEHDAKVIEAAIEVVSTTNGLLATHETQALRQALADRDRKVNHEHR